jgi:GT2 family glycosyltransferase
MTERDPLVGVVVIHYGLSRPTLRCLESLLEDPSITDREIVVVDNFDNLEPHRLPAGVHLVRRPDNPGFGGGANAGVTALPGGFPFSAYVFLNNDTEVLPGFLAGCAASVQRERIGCAGGPIWADRDLTSLWYAGGGVRWVTGTVWQSRRADAAHQGRTVGFIPGTAMALRPEAWHEVQGFDQSYFLYNEDIDLCLRLRRAGWDLWFDPTIQCIHHLGETTGSDSRSPLYLENIGRTRFRPFRPAAYRLYLALVHSVYNTLRAGALVARGGRRNVRHVRALIRGHLAACRSVFGSTTGDRGADHR